MQKDSFLLGSLLGLLAPILAYLFITYTSIQQSLFSDKPIALYVIAAVINVVIFRFAYRAGKQSFAKGVLLVTFIVMLGLIFLSKFKVG